jgi:hypothetical protein
MSSVKLVSRSLGKWAVPRRSFQSSAVFRATAEQQEEAATQRNILIYFDSNPLFDNFFYFYFFYNRC